MNLGAKSGIRCQLSRLMLHRAETFHFGNKPKREITAPFQDGGVSQHMPTKETMKKDFVDYSNFKFVPLEDEKAVVFEKVD